MTLRGDWSWWMPRFLDWIPRVTIEREPDEPVTTGPDDQPAESDAGAAA